MKTLEADMKEMESKKRILEEAVDSLNEEIAKLKAKGNVQNCLLLRCNPEFFSSSHLKMLFYIPCG